MATNQMEEACISRQRNKVLGAIIERCPDSNLRALKSDSVPPKYAERTTNEPDAFKTPTLGETSVVVRNYTAGRETIVRGGAAQVTDLPAMTVITVWKEQR